MPKIDVKEKLEGNEIDLSLCNLVSIPVEELACFTDATCLDLSHNMIASIPPSFCTLTHLVRIDLSHNQLSDLPADFGDLVNLQHLDLRSNQLTTLPASFRHLRGLRWLDLGSNPLIPAMRERAGDCHNERECQLCAKNVVAYMKEAAEKANREDLIQRKNGAYQLLYRFLRIPYMAVLVLVLAGGTVWYGGTRIKDNLYHNALVPACNQLRDGVFVSARLAGHVWQCFISIFRSGHKAFAKGDGVCT